MRVTSKGQVTIPIENRQLLDIGPVTRGEERSAFSVDTNVIVDILRRDPAAASATTAGGARPSPLPDVYIGAHAAVDGLTVVTRDGARFRT